MPSPADTATIQAHFDGVHSAQQEAEAEWGAGRLPLLVDDALRAKFYRQQELWRSTYEAAWLADTITTAMLDEVASKAAAMKRAWAAIAAAASEAGHRPLHAEVWEGRLPDGTVFAVVRSDAEVAHVVASGRHVVVWTMDELGNVIGELFPHVVSEAKRVFPGVKVTARFDRSWAREGDAIPFGGD